MNFVKSTSMKVTVSDEQRCQLSSDARMSAGLEEENVIAFDIFDENKLIGFAMLREFQPGQFFLWNYAIDYQMQNQHYGTNALKELISYLKEHYRLKVMTTTYVDGNNHAKAVYLKNGFVITDVVDEPDCKEVNMRYTAEV